MHTLLVPGLLSTLLAGGCTEYGLDTLPAHQAKPDVKRHHADVVTDDEPAVDTGEPDEPPGDIPDTGTPTGDDSDPGGGDSGGGETGWGDSGGGETGQPDTGEPTPELTAQVCEDSEGDDCNGDLGYGDQCDPSDNTNGCSADKFWAWCNRRNPAYPDIWYDWLYDWVDDRCDGYVALVDDDGDGYESFTCLDSSGVVYSCTTPLVLSFTPAGDVRYTSVAHSFPLDTDKGTSVRHDWPTPETPWLALDRDGNGKIDDGSELFGSSTGLGAGERAHDGFSALAPLDADGDGRITQADPRFVELLVWGDVDGDGVSGAGEVRRLDEVGVLALSLASVEAPRCDGRGNCAREQSAFQYVGPDGAHKTGAVVDVYVRSRPASAQQVASTR